MAPALQRLPHMLGLAILAAVVAVGLLMIAALVLAAVRSVRRDLETRRRARALTERVEQAKRMAAERAERQAQIAAAANFAPAPAALAIGSVTFPSVEAPAPVRTAKGSLPPPIAHAPAPARVIVPVTPAHGTAHVVRRELPKRS